MDNNTVTQSIITSINTIFEQIFGSISNNLYSTLDEITFIDSKILRNNYFENILGTSTTNGILLIANSMLLRYYNLLFNKIYVIPFYIYRNGVS